MPSDSGTDQARVCFSADPKSENQITSYLSDTTLGSAARGSRSAGYLVHKGGFMSKQFDKLVAITAEEQRYIDARVHDIESAGGRARWIYASIVVVSLLLLSMAYNSIFSWSRAIADVLEDGGPVRSTWNDVFNKELARRWIESLHFDVPLLGAKFSASDAGIVGGTLLLFMGVWCFFSARRENHLMYYIVRDIEIHRAKLAVKMYARTQLSATQIFTHGWHDNAFTSADVIRKGEADAKQCIRPQDRFARGILIVMFYLPVIALSAVFASDIYSLFLDSPIRPGNETLIDFLKKSCNDGECRNCGAVRNVGIRLGISFLLLFGTWVIMHRSYGFQKGTSDIMRLTANWNPKNTEDN